MSAHDLFADMTGNKCYDATSNIPRGHCLGRADVLRVRRKMPVTVRYQGVRQGTVLPSTCGCVWRGVVPCRVPGGDEETAAGRSGQCGAAHTGADPGGSRQEGASRGLHKSQCRRGALWLAPQLSICIRKSCCLQGQLLCKMLVEVLLPARLSMTWRHAHASQQDHDEGTLLLQEAQGRDASHVEVCGILQP